jgi:hypothetical protein
MTGEGEFSRENSFSIYRNKQLNSIGLGIIRIAGDVRIRVCGEVVGLYMGVIDTRVRYDMISVKAIRA